MYDINYKLIEKNIRFYLLFFIIGLIVGIVFIYAFSYAALIFFPLPIIFICIGLIPTIKLINRLKKVKELNVTGTLYKNIPYKLERTGMKVNNKRVLKPVIDFKMPNGEILHLEGDPRHDFIQRDIDGMIDLVIDLNNPQNYFMDFNIDRKEGNRREDFYTSPEEVIKNMNNNTRY